MTRAQRIAVLRSALCLGIGLAVGTWLRVHEVPVTVEGILAVFPVACLVAFAVDYTLRKHLP